MAQGSLRFSKCIVQNLFRTPIRRLSKVPDKPTWIPVDDSLVPETPIIDKDLIDHLERISLVEFGDKEAVESLSNSITSANQLHVVNTEGVEPLDTVLEARPLYLREDTITDGDCREELMKTAVKTEEEYYVAPSGNIPLKKTDRDYWKDKKS